MKEDEKILLVNCWKRDAFPEDIAKEIGMHPRRLAYILDKWTRKDWYNWGVRLEIGWLEQAGKMAAMTKNIEGFR